MAADLAKKDDTIAELKETIACMSRELASHKSRLQDDADGGAGGAEQGGAAERDGAAGYVTRAEYRRASAEYEAKKGGADPAPADRKRKKGGQPGHTGVSRGGAVDAVRHFRPELCHTCGRSDMEIVKTDRKRVYELAPVRMEILTFLYVIRVGRCRMCGTLTAPHTDCIRGTSFGPLLRAHIHAYRDGHATVGDIVAYLRDIEGAVFSEGAVSACISAIARDEDGQVPAAPLEEPVRLGETLRGYRSPLEPREPDDTDHALIDAALTQRSNLWTSSLPLPLMAQIAERQTMDPHFRTDESGNWADGGPVQTSVLETDRTTSISIIRHRDAETLYRRWGHMKDRPAMRDGTKGYEWHKERASVSRCNVHLLRDAEGEAMRHDMGSPQYVRHRDMREMYRDADHIREEAVRRAGGTLACASELDIIKRVPGLEEYVERHIRRLTGRVEEIIGAGPDDSVATTVLNALPDMFNAIRYPGELLNNNGIERTIRDSIVPDRNRVRYPDMVGAYNFSVMRTVSATCKKNGTTAFEAVLCRARDPGWNLFNRDRPPPIFAGGRGITQAG